MHGAAAGRFVRHGRAGLTLATRRAEVLSLLREFSFAVSRPGVGRDPRLILHRLIRALEARLQAEAARDGPDPAALSSPLHDPLSDILAELKAVSEHWDAKGSGTVTSDFAHAMDALLMYEVREESRFDC
jgi:hypothetical protein